MLRSGESALIPCVGSGAEEFEADFALPTAGCTVILTGPLGNPIHSLNVPAMARGLSWAMTDGGSYQTSDMATPGFSNDSQGYAQWLSAVGAENTAITISEIMSRNRSALLSAKGTFCDWVELVNNGTTAADLSGAYLSNDPAELTKWQIPHLILQPGERAVIPCAADAAAENEADFGLSGDGCTVILTGKAGLKDMTGMVGIVDLVSEATAATENVGQAWLTILYFGGFIAVNLAVMNLLPIPALDGGRAVGLLLTTTIEAITRKKINPKYEGYIHGIGLILLLILMAVITFKDIFFIIKR
jgi:hypothetical protein